MFREKLLLKEKLEKTTIQYIEPLISDIGISETTRSLIEAFFARNSQFGALSGQWALVAIATDNTTDV